MKSCRLRVLLGVLLVTCVAVLFMNPYFKADVDYEMVALSRFLDDYAFHRELPRASLCTEKCWWVPFYRGGRKAFWNDETYRAGHVTLWHPWAGNALYFDGGGGRCPSGGIECHALTVAAMSLFLRGGSPVATLAAPRVASDSDFEEWKAKRPVFANYLYVHHRPERIKARKDLERACGEVIPNRHGTERKTVMIFDEAVGIGSDARFGIAHDHRLEGSGAIQRGYVSEKIVNAFLSGSIPLYWGSSPDVAKQFNPKAFIDMRAFESPEAAVAHVCRVAHNDTLLRAMLEEPPCEEEHLRRLLWWRYKDEPDAKGWIDNELVTKEVWWLARWWEGL